ncbi:MAG: hypothetical protein OEV89_09285 [Desulfobulbaceae bacterium]|nr:hypothetical protein [Desulfobulbaceae bacterium]HIJ90884.1 hypothetical protein [Deltaproteobacteria bacterium]
MKMKLKRSIGFKMAVAMTVGLFVVISLFSHTSVKLSEKRLLAMAEKEASKISAAIKGSLDNAMCAEGEGSVQKVIDAVGRESMVHDVKLINRDAEVKYAKNPGEIGLRLDQSVKSCALCHDKATVTGDNLTVLFTDADGHRILRNVNPIHNEERCHSCHADDPEVLGKLLVDFTTEDIDWMVMENRKLLIFSAIAILLSSTLLCFLLAAVLVKRPLRNLLLKMKFADNGEADALGAISGDDEIAILDETYDSLMQTLEARNQRINQQMEEMLALFNVSEILNKSDSIDDNINLILKALSIGFHVRQCAVLTVNGAGGLVERGACGMDADKINAVIAALADPELYEMVDVGKTFLASGCEGVADFLAVPIKSSGNIVGVITVHEVSGMEITDDELRKSFAIIATSLAPHFQIGLARAEKQEMQESPFNAFIVMVESEIAKVREYYGSLSLVLVSVNNYSDLCRERGAEAASQAVQELAKGLSVNLAVVHECCRIGVHTVAVILPMLDSMEAPQTVNAAIVALGSDLSLRVKIATFPDNGDTALVLLHALR